MREIIQHMLFPEGDMPAEQFELYYRGLCGVVLSEQGEQKMAVGRFQQIAFDTYFNGCSIQKWKEYTTIRKASLFLEACGSFLLSMYGCSLNQMEPQRKSYGWRRYDLTKRSVVEIEIPDDDMQIAGLELRTLSDVEIYGGGCIGDFPDSREINLSIVTTTCRKEAFIKKNIHLLYHALLSRKDETAQHLFVHIVDNGRTLKASDFPKHEHIYLHSNKNTGGSGGFARGILESVYQKKQREQKEKITHIQLMDDDILLQPDSIYRTYILLKHLKRERQDDFISGAMLYMERAFIQKEDVGMVSRNAEFVPLKREFNHKDLRENLMNEKKYPDAENCYAAWWYCCMPVSVVKKYGLPLPLFVRGDDIEYGLRCRPRFLTMNGICVWHMGFVGKMNAAMDFYQVDRNLLIIRAVSGVLKNVRILRKLRMDFLRSILRFDYDSAQLVVRALEDYLKGPEFIKKDCGEQILKENSRLVHMMKPLETLGTFEAMVGSPYEKIELGRIERLIYKITCNGHLLFPEGRLRREMMSVPFNDVYIPGRAAFRTKLLAVNPAAGTGYLLVRDKKRFWRLVIRYCRAVRRYRRDNSRLMEEYAASKHELMSERFWREYLEI